MKIVHVEESWSHMLCHGGGSGSDRSAGLQEVSLDTSGFCCLTSGKEASYEFFMLSELRRLHCRSRRSELSIKSIFIKLDVQMSQSACGSCEELWQPERERLCWWQLISAPAWVTVCSEVDGTGSICFVLLIDFNVDWPHQLYPSWEQIERDERRLMI